MMATSSSSCRRRVALVMGVANHRSIAWACVQEFLARRTDCVLTFHPRFGKHVDRLVSSVGNDDDETRGKILGHFPCQVETEDDLPRLFQTQLPKLLTNVVVDDDNGRGGRQVDAIVHSIAFADMEGTESLGRASWPVYAQAQHVSSYSLIATARCATLATLPSSSDDNHDAPPRRLQRRQPLLADQASLTALSYIGAVRASKPYHVMGPAKAALEANVRGLAAEYGSYVHTNGDDDNDDDDNNEGSTAAAATTTTKRSLRVNAVSAGPVATLSSRGGIADFAGWSRRVADQSPLQRLVTTAEISAAVRFLSSEEATGITGQTVYVDAGFSSVL